MTNNPPSSPPLETNQNSNTINSIDNIIETYIPPSSSTLFYPILISLSWIFDSQQTFISIFSDSGPKSHCNSPSPQPPHTSTISQFSLPCSLQTLPSSTFYAGCLLGGLLFATLADSRLGRKHTLVLSSLSMSISASLAAASPNFPIYVSLRFVSGFSRATVGTTAYVLSSELVPRPLRNHVNLVTLVFSAVGFLSLPFISFLNRSHSWRLLYLYTSIPSLCYTIFLHFFIIESPRWLLIQGRRKQAIQTLKKLSNKTVTFSNFPLKFAPKTESAGLFSAAILLWGKPWAMRRILIVVIVGFGVGMMYYGMPLNLGILNENLYVSVALNAVIEIPSALVVILVANVASRRVFIVGMIVVSGLCSLGCSWLRGWLAVAAEVAAFFGAFASFSMEVIYVMELFPTCVRNSAVSVVRQAVVLGGVAAPALVAVGRRRRFLSFGVFGIVIVIFGLFVVLLPETKGREMSDTMEEEEDKMMVNQEC